MIKLVNPRTRNFFPLQEVPFMNFIMGNSGRPGEPRGDMFTLRESIQSGRGLVAEKAIPKDTLVLETSELTVSIVYHEYRKEACAYCFAYDRGKHWKCRNSETGFVFCSDTCNEAWKESVSQIGIDAWTAVHTFAQRSKRQDENMVDQCGPRPGLVEIDEKWGEAERFGKKLVAARCSSKKEPATARDKAALRYWLAEPANPDQLHLLTSATLKAAERPYSRWAKHTSLEEDPTPYRSKSELLAHRTSYLQILGLLPISLLPFATREVCQAACSRASHNAFGLRPDSDEFLGWGVWPSASYFNHSCAPNLRKERHGRTWLFYASGDVEPGDELCKSNLGGIEVSLHLWQRRLSLDFEWSFVCRCPRCAEEEQILEEHKKHAAS